MATQKESLFSKRVRKRLDAIPYCWSMRCHGLLAGLPDLIGCVNGQFFALELKTSAKAPRSKLQGYVIDKIQSAGGYARFVYPENEEETFKHLHDFVWRQK